MESELTKLGSSLLVPWVQELVKQPLTAVPPRYVRPDQEPPPLSATHVSSLQVPVIDMEKLVSGDFVSLELEKLHSACKEWGFFQLINHGVNISVVEEVKGKIEELFKLPMDEKKKLWQQPGDIEGFGQAFVVSEEQKLDWCDMFFMTTLPPSMRRAHLFPNLPPPIRDAIEAYAVELKNLALRVLNLQAKALKIDPMEITSLFEEGFQSMRMNFYPPCPQPEVALGLSPHSDGAGLSILRQLNDVEGLEIKKDGIWVPLKPLPNAFVVNIGDILEVVSNGIYRSIEHRGTVNSEKERLSVATFYNPKMDSEIGPAPSLVTPQTPAEFKRIGVAEYYRQFFARKLDGKSFIDSLRIQSHENEST